MLGYYYSDTIDLFEKKSTNEIIGQITNENQFDSNRNTNQSWRSQIEIINETLIDFQGEKMTINCSMDASRMSNEQLNLDTRKKVLDSISEFHQ